MTNASGDIVADQDTLTRLLSHFGESQEEFGDDPNTDTIFEVSSWSNAVCEYGSQLEDRYGSERTASMFHQAWQEVRA